MPTSASLPADFFVLLLAVPLIPLATWLLQLGLGAERAKIGAWLGTVGLFTSAAIALWLYRQAAVIDPTFLWSSVANGGPQWHWFGGTLPTDAAHPGTGSTLQAFAAGLRYDALTAPLLLMVTLVSALVHLFSTRYMRGDRRYGAYFAGLGLFSFAMLAMLVSDNLLFLFLFWELMGFCSWFLIGHNSFDRDRPQDRAAAAAVKAFLTTRVGDLALLLGIATLWFHCGTLEFQGLQRAVAEAREANGAWPDWAQTVGLLIVLGAVGKSAQFPLHVWLPDAMAGPTPVSAMIHAATMVAAGVYLVVRSFPMFSPSVLAMLALIGAFTSLFAALIALCSFDLKRVLAWSTISQLGYMIAAVGVGSPEGAVFHVFTHGMFKAGLFLAAGAVIHACRHQQDLRQLGGLARRLPVTALTMLIFCLAISGLPWLSGFYSKDAILAAALHHGRLRPGPVGWLPIAFLFASALLTGLYMFRLYLMTFAKSPRSEDARSARENPIAMTLPLGVLALLSIAAASLWLVQPALDEEVHHTATLWATLAAFAGVGLAFLAYGMGGRLPVRIAGVCGPLYRAIVARFGIDEFYQLALVSPLRLVGRLSAIADREVVDALFTVVGRTAVGIGRSLRRLQSGRIQDSLYFTYAGLLGLALWFVGRAIG